ncbi:type I HSP40 co-chaperone HLJ1 NDAI_0H03180 [Naumovozyma dairenensis CBS 421]|uniref:J domain-containing protein n=1 Tax=Naumovozyma dairenensis (strain ATCC 10597 / BCRC 20456 / CBS 421 / NBRC 0211 / NRRL Y-12639) TaxID=1071378 RepID=G0WFD0_NAUDC|nr:hypothetical protein NDAI_0H03180 [Naumovozyma dairenensis CBS 421]CCD26491.1 hypothetical protein NDAI_0H03180 [Naumovozyma dairenensis CBS 421]
MEYSQDQEKLALDILSKDKHAFYEILKVERTSTENEIKKAYRKLAIRLHPDKNPHPKASEAFKIINRAFEVLSDNEKRRIFDQLGRDPDDRNAAASAGSGFARASGTTNMGGFEDIFFGNRRHHHHPAAATGFNQPEDIFDFLFNMNGGGNPFMNAQQGPTFTFGGPGGFRVYTNGQGGRHAFQRQQQRRQQTEAQNNPEGAVNQDIIKIMLPLILFFLLPVIERLLFG